MAKQPTPQVQPTAQVPARLSHKAAAVAQQMENLEDDLTEALQRAQDAENRAKIAEGRVEQLTSDLKGMTEDRDKYFQLWTEVRTDLETSGSIILKAMDRGAAVNNSRSRQEALQAVDQALAETPLQPMPAFLAAGPRDGNGKE